jgi:hypothetical protein
MLMLKNVTILYPNLFTAREYQGDGRFNYDAEFILTPAQAAEVEKEMRKICAETAPSDKKLYDRTAAEGKSPMKSGDLSKTDAAAGGFILKSKASTKRPRPLVLDRDKSAITDESKIYSGCLVNAKINLWYCKMAGTTPVNRLCCDLLAVQFIADGPRIGSAAAVNADDFDALEIPKGGDLTEFDDLMDGL